MSIYRFWTFIQLGGVRETQAIDSQQNKQSARG
jgi:hypothetical protein